MEHFDWTRIALFADFGPQDLEPVKRIFTKVQVDSGQKLIREGDEGDEMFILVSGRVRITKSMILKGMVVPLEELHDPRKTLATLDGEVCPLFGEMALIDRDTRSATVETLATCEFLRTDREQFFALVEAHPVIGVRLLMALSRRLASTVRRSNSEIVKLTTALALALSRL